MIIGCCGAGKSTFARALAERLPLPLIHLDQYFWLPGWREVDREQWLTINRELVARENWIMDGNYGSTMDLRLERAETVIFLDTSRWICLWRVLKRIFLNYGRVRSDLVEGCPERFDWPFLKYVYNFHREKRPALLAKLEQLSSSRQVIHIRNRREWQHCLEALCVN